MLVQPHEDSVRVITNGEELLLITPTDCATISPLRIRPNCRVSLGAVVSVSLMVINVARGACFADSGGSAGALDRPPQPTKANKTIIAKSVRIDPIVLTLYKKERPAKVAPYSFFVTLRDQCEWFRSIRDRFLQSHPPRATSRRTCPEYR